MRNPLLRSIGVLNALFHNAVVVTESDSDRAFYQEINERLVSSNDSRGIKACLFLNAQNKQTVWDIVKPLRELGIPAVGIVDIDVLKEGGSVFHKLLDGGFFPAIRHAALQADRKGLLSAFEETGKNMKRDGGIQLLDSTARAACSDFLSQLADYGVFVVENGELESWLPSLGITRSKNTWLPSMFTQMGDDPSADSYVKPTPGDVWDFIGGITRWVEDPRRKGIPN